MRVLTVGNSFPPHDQGGGYEAVWAGAVEHLEARGHQVRVLTVERAGGEELPEVADTHRDLRWYWRDHAFPPTSVRESLAIERHNVSALKRHIAGFEPDVVSWWSIGGMSVSLVEVVRRLGLPAVAFVHDDWLDYAPRVDAWHRRTRRLRRVRFGEAAHYAFVSETTRAHALKRLELPDTSVVTSGIAPVFAPAPETEWRGRLLYVGRIDPRKGVATAVEALAHLPDMALRVVGSGAADALADLEGLAASLGVASRVEFAGQVAVERLPTEYAGADAVVFPVVWSEPWGLVPLEAMATGRPVVATGRGGSGEYLVDGVNALLFPAGDARELADRVQRLAADPGLRDSLRQPGFETAARHTAARFNEGVEAALSARTRQRT